MRKWEKSRDFFQFSTCSPYQEKILLWFFQRTDCVFETNYQLLNTIDVFTKAFESCSTLNCINYLKLMDHCVVYPATLRADSNWNKNFWPFLFKDDTIICQQCLEEFGTNYHVIGLLMWLLLLFYVSHTTFKIFFL